MAVRRRPARAAPGQHFLRSGRLASDLIDETGIGPGDLVVEIGAGTGVLTRALGRTRAEVIALEIDPALVAQLRRQSAALRNVTVLEADALTVSWPARAFAVVANLPFAQSGAILGRLLRDPGVNLRRAHIIVQWEFASKHAAVWPATLRATYWRAWYDLSITRRLARTAFSPTPGVDAAVLGIVRRRHPRVPPEAHDSYWRFLSAAFRAQPPVRKSLGPRVSPLQMKRLAPVLGFAPHARPRDLDAGQWARLFAFATKHSAE